MQEHTLLLHLCSRMAVTMPHDVLSFFLIFPLSHFPSYKITLSLGLDHFKPTLIHIYHRKSSIPASQYNPSCVSPQRPSLSSLLPPPLWQQSTPLPSTTSVPNSSLARTASPASTTCGSSPTTLVPDSMMLSSTPTPQMLSKAISVPTT